MLTATLCCRLSLARKRHCRWSFWLIVREYWQQLAYAWSSRSVDGTLLGHTWRNLTERNCWSTKTNKTVAADGVRCRRDRHVSICLRLPLSLSGTPPRRYIRRGSWWCSRLHWQTLCLITWSTTAMTTASATSMRSNFWRKYRISSSHGSSSVWFSPDPPGKIRVAFTTRSVYTHSEYPCAVLFFPRPFDQTARSCITLPTERVDCMLPILRLSHASLWRATLETCTCCPSLRGLDALDSQMIPLRANAKYRDLKSSMGR